jgi:hypothetical protein
LVLQGDGNMVLASRRQRHKYGDSGVIWASNTNNGARLVMQDDCNLVLYGSGGGMPWASGSNCGPTPLPTAEAPVHVPAPDTTPVFQLVSTATECSNARSIETRLTSLCITKPLVCLFPLRATSHTPHRGSYPHPHPDPIETKEVSQSPLLRMTETKDVSQSPLCQTKDKFDHRGRWFADEKCFQRVAVGSC